MCYQCLHTVDEFEGAGIGFANVRRSVNRHGGQVWAEVRERRGAIFLSLPGSRRRIMDDIGIILLVEDNPNDVEITRATLGENRPILGISAANDGKEALDYVCRPGAQQPRPAAKPGVALLDLKLPKVDVLEVPQCIKTDPGMKTIVVVMPTSSREEDDLLRSCDLGTNAYVVKPISYEGSIEAIRKVGLFWGTLNQLPSTTDHDQWP